MDKKQFQYLAVKSITETEQLLNTITRLVWEAGYHPQNKKDAEAHGCVVLKPLFTHKEDNLNFEFAMQEFIRTSDYSTSKSDNCSSKKFFIQQILKCAIVYYTIENFHEDFEFIPNNFTDYQKRKPRNYEIAVVSEACLDYCTSVFAELTEQDIQALVDRLKPIYSKHNKFEFLHYIYKEQEVEYTTIDRVDYAIVKLYVYTILALQYISVNIGK